MSGAPDLDYRDFVRSRKLFWMQEARTLDTGVKVPKFEEVTLEESESKFIVWCSNHTGTCGVFEDSGDVGWFYLFDSASRRILNATHVYNGDDVQVEATDVDVIWSVDGEISAIAIWAEIRGFLGRSKALKLRRRVYTRDTRGFDVSEWPDGFRHFGRKSQSHKKTG